MAQSGPVSRLPWCGQFMRPAHGVSMSSMKGSVTSAGKWASVVTSWRHATIIISDALVIAVAGLPMASPRVSTAALVIAVPLQSRRKMLVVTLFHRGDSVGHLVAGVQVRVGILFRMGFDRDGAQIVRPDKSVPPQPAPRKRGSDDPDICARVKVDSALPPPDGSLPGVEMPRRKRSSRNRSSASRPARPGWVIKASVVWHKMRGASASPAYATGQDGPDRR
jgi:hypothetical protein